MKNFEQQGETVTWRNATGAAVLAGAVIALGAGIGVAVTDIANNADGAVQRLGIVELDAVNNAAFVQGDFLFYDLTAKKLTLTASATTKIAGLCTAAKAETGTKAKVLLANNLPQASALVTLTDNSGGTAGDTIAAIGGTYNQAEVRNAIASLAAKINSVITTQRSSGQRVIGA